MQKIKANDGTNRGIIHGLCHTPEYTVYVGMKARCHNPKNLRYSDYGGRGIFVCEKWFHNFEAFYLDMGPRPTEKHQLDRIDNNKGYSPDNCQWVEPNINALNKRKYTNNKSGFKGVSFDKRAKLKPWRATIMRNKKQIQVGAFVTAKEANDARQQYIKNNNIDD
ncbi:HNH endonuclease [Morganella phage vB_MmoM_MP1]|uniref:AP2/ERF domain-containing protein n=1 Tax=Morganella phage vB_MmoM_MP1 TaxID=1852628 RepID=A0A192Y9T7_9CAUD|nr:HNH endonuclease [Morganella phage vB_MmoM_MP1]ANM46494.1 hypothetical protein MP1_gp0269 [Morganella phage vB_MmoM_MP1]